MAASCRGNRQCAKCGGDHDIQKCEVTTPKCCNCGGSHLASFKECGHFVKAKQVQEVRDQHKISYAAAVKRVEGLRGPGNVERTPTGGSLMSHLPSSDMSNQIRINKESLLAYIVDVIFGAREKRSRSDIIKFVPEAAVRSLGIKEYSPQSLHEFMKTRQVIPSQESRSPSEIGDEEGEEMEEPVLCENVDDV